MISKGRNVAKHRAKILVVEDEALVAIELETRLFEAGFVVLGPALTLQTAIALLQKDVPDAAILEFNVGGKKVTPVANKLRSVDVPFVIASAHPDYLIKQEKGFESAVNIGKLPALWHLKSVLKALVANRRQPIATASP